MRSGGHGFSGIGRMRLLNILQERARALGIKIEFETEAKDVSAYADYDLIVGADGGEFSGARHHADVFKPDIDVRACKYIWLGSIRNSTMLSLSSSSRPSTAGSGHTPTSSTPTPRLLSLNVRRNWRRARLQTDEHRGDNWRPARKIFARNLGGHKLMSNARHLRGSAWLNFNRVLCERWESQNIVLLGDAAATAHFSVGSGSKLALESAIALADYLHSERP